MKNKFLLFGCMLMLLMGSFCVSAFADVDDVLTSYGYAIDQTVASLSASSSLTVSDSQTIGVSALSGSSTPGSVQSYFSVGKSYICYFSDDSFIIFTLTSKSNSANGVVLTISVIDSDGVPLDSSSAISTFAVVKSDVPGLFADVSSYLSSVLSSVGSFFTSVLSESTVLLFVFLMPIAGIVSSFLFRLIRRKGR